LPVFTLKRMPVLNLHFEL